MEFVTNHGGGRYVTIQLDTPNNLSLAEVVVPAYRY
jgi:hypothetical protein